MRVALIAMVLLLFGCKERGVAPKRTAVVGTADQIFAGMTFNIVKNGIRQSLVIADSAWTYTQRQSSDLKTMKVTMYDSTGALISTITAEKGVYSIRDQMLDARGHVVATSPGGKVLKTEHLVFDSRRNLVTSDSAFTSTSPQGNAAGASFESDPGFKRITIVKPKNILQKGKGIRIGGYNGGASK